MVTLASLKDQNEWVFCSIGSGGVASEEIQKLGKKVILLESPVRIPSLEAIKKLYRILKNEKPDVIHTSGAEANFHGILAAKLAGIKRVIAEEIGVPGQSRLANFTFKQTFRFADAVVCNSILVQDYLQNKNGVPIEKIKVIANPVRGNLGFMMSQSPTGNFELITASRLEPVKNIEGVLEVIPDLIKINSKLRFTIIGEGTERKTLQEFVSAKELAHHVRFLGFQRESFKAVMEADLFILNSKSEGFSNALAEAMIAGIPAITTDVGAVSEMVEEGVSGWVIPSNQRDELKSKLSQLIQLSKAELSRIGLAGRNRILSKYSIERHIKELMEVYN